MENNVIRKFLQRDDDIARINNAHTYGYGQISQLSSVVRKTWTGEGTAPDD
jgi:hypothetical protein